MKNKEEEKLELAPDELDLISGGSELNPVLPEGETEAKEGTYVVQKGDSLHSIAEKYKVSTEALFLWNMAAIIQAANEHGHIFLDPGKYADLLFPGTVLRLP